MLRDQLYNIVLDDVTSVPRVLLWPTFCIHTEMLPVERVVAD
jgi:hypothetical protein